MTPKKKRLIKTRSETFASFLAHDFHEPTISITLVQELALINSAITGRACPKR